MCADLAPRARILVFSSTRADLAPLTPLLEELSRREHLDYTVSVAGTLGHPDFGDPISALGVDPVRLTRFKSVLQGATFAEQEQGGRALAADVADYLVNHKPDVLVVLGDRWELLYVVPVAALAGVPIVHLAGGDVTAGAFDDRVRHAVSKLADFHCPATVEAGLILRQLGEPADRVFVTGAPALDRMGDVVPMPDEELTSLLGSQVTRPFGLITYHPVTAGASESPRDSICKVLGAAGATLGSGVITHPGLDRGRGELMVEISAFVADHPGFVDVAALGADYLRVMASADVVLGNSSSGVIEAASLRVPVVNVGDRQLGRPSAANVIDCPEVQEDIEAAMRCAFSAGFRNTLGDLVNVYGDGDASRRVADVIELAASGTDWSRKPFVRLDLDR